MAQTCPHTVAFKCNNIKLVVYCYELPLLGDGIRQFHDVSQLCSQCFGGRASVANRAILAFLRNTQPYVRTYEQTGYGLFLKTAAHDSQIFTIAKIGSPDKEIWP